MKETHTAMQEDARRSRRRLGFAVAAAVLGGAWILFGDDLTTWARGLRRYRGEWIWQGGTESRLGEVDLRDVHETLLGDWVVALDDPPADEAAAFESLRRAVAASPGLALAAEDLRAAALDDADPEAWVAAARAWTRTVEDQGLPWRVEGSWRGGRAGPGVFYLRVYEVLDQGPVTVDGVPRTVRFLRRADQLNVVEARLGHTPDEEGVGYVLVDRVVQFAADDLWAVLDPAEAGPRAAHRAGIDAALARSLDAEDLAVLREAAPWREALRATLEAVNARHGCSRYTIRFAPWHGMTPETLERMEQIALGDRGQPCPALTLDEVAALRTASEALAATRGLDRAVAALVGHVARGVALHEARHVADQGAGLDAVGVEHAAYLAALSHPDLGPAAFLQACIGASGAHGLALDATGLDCAAPPTDLVAALAPAREAAGVSGAPTIPPDLARLLPLKD